MQKRYQNAPAATTGAVNSRFNAPHGASNDQVARISDPTGTSSFASWGESAAAERASYRGNVFHANLNRVHHPKNTEAFGTNGTTGDKLITHRGRSPTWTPLSHKPNGSSLRSGRCQMLGISALPEKNIRRGRWELPALAEGFFSLRLLPVMLV